MSKVKVLVFGDKSKCSICKGAYSKMEANIIGLLGDADIGYEFLDATANAKGYAAGKKFVGKASIPKYPQLFILNGLKVVGSFVVRNMTAATVAKKVIALCVDCGESTPEPTLYKQCPTCKGMGVVAIALACLMTLFNAGCCVTSIKTPEASGWRFACLYPFETGSASIKTLNGSAEVGNYKTSGGAAELVPLVDASGKLVGTFIGTAAKTAVVP